MGKPINIEKIPQTASNQELGQFWDNHDLADFEAHLEKVTEPIFVRGTIVQTRLQPTEAVQKVTQLRGIDYTELIRGWSLRKV